MRKEIARKKYLLRKQIGGCKCFAINANRQQAVPVARNQEFAAKNEDIQSLQDTFALRLKGIAAYAYHARELGRLSRRK